MYLAILLWLDFLLLTLQMLNSILHGDLYALPKQIRTHTLFRDTMVTWRHLKRKLRQHIHLSPYRTIHGIIHFHKSRNYPMYPIWCSNNLLPYAQLYYEDQARLKPFGDLICEFGLLKIALSSIPSKSSHMRRLTSDLVKAFRKTLPCATTPWGIFIHVFGLSSTRNNYSLWVLNGQRRSPVITYLITTWIPKNSQIDEKWNLEGNPIQDPAQKHI